MREAMRQQEQLGTGVPKMGDTRHQPPGSAHKLPRSDSNQHMTGSDFDQSKRPDLMSNKSMKELDSGHGLEGARGTQPGKSSSGSRNVQSLHGIQKQLIQLALLLQGRMTLDELANAVDVPNDPSTRLLLEKLNTQLAKAVKQKRKDSPAGVVPHSSRHDGSNSDHGHAEEDGEVRAALAQLLAHHGHHSSQQSDSRGNQGGGGGGGGARFGGGSRYDLDNSMQEAPRGSSGHTGPDGSGNPPGGRSRQYSQQSSYNTQAMSISEGSNSPYSYDGHGGDSFGNQRSRREDLLDPAAEQLSAKAKVHNYLDKYGQEAPRPVPGTDPAFRTGERGGNGRQSSHQSHRSSGGMDSKGQAPGSRSSVNNPGAGYKNYGNNSGQSGRGRHSNQWN